MKDFRGMKRQRSRNRKTSGGNQNNPNRAYESNGPEGTKVRGNAQTIYEKYQQLARDANSAGDRVLAENHLQHAEHYFRMIRLMQPQRPVSEFVQRDPFATAFDDYDDDIEPAETETEAETQGAPEEQLQGDEQPRFDNRDRNRDRNRDNRDRNFRDRDNNRNFEQRAFEPRNGQPNGEAQDGEGGRRESRRERYERRRAQRIAEQQDTLNGAAGYANGTEQPNAAPAFIASTQPLTPVGGRTSPSDLVSTPQPEPRRERSAASGDAAQLPAFLHRPAPVAAEAEAAPAEEAVTKPRRGRPRRKPEDATPEASEA